MTRQLSEEELGAWNIYDSLNKEYGGESYAWDQLDDWEKEYYLKFFRVIDNQAKVLADRIDKEVLARMIDNAQPQ